MRINEHPSLINIALVYINTKYTLHCTMGKIGSKCGVGISEPYFSRFIRWVVENVNLELKLKLNLKLDSTESAAF